MNKKSLIFKIASIILLVLDISFLLFFSISIALVIAKTTLLSNLHIVAFIVFLIVNLLYVGYVSALLILNKVKASK